MRKKVFYVLVPIIIVLVIALFLFNNKASAPPANQQAPSPTTTPAQPADTFDKKKYSLDDPTSLWVIVNKKHPLPTGYVPADLTDIGGGQMRAEAATALQQLFTEAQKQNVPVHVISAYRSYDSQVSTYNAYVAKDGVEKADTYSARPGFSEHQTGQAVDVGNGKCDLELCFGELDAGEWLVVNAPNFGFVIRYPQGKGASTGYQYEPWHLRYVGKDLATEVQKNNQTLEEFFGLDPAPSY